MKKIVYLLVLFSLSFVLCGCEEQKLAYPDSKTIVTRSEYEKLETGMKIEEVDKIVGGECIKKEEKDISGSKQVIYECNAKGEDEAIVTLTYFQDMLFAKNESGLE